MSGPIIHLYLPVEGTHAFFLVVDVFTVVLSTVRPLEYALAFHLIVLPFTLVLTAVTPIVNT